MSEIETTTETTETPAPQTSDAGGEGSESSEGGEHGTPEPTPYTPNFKFKSYDKEQEIPESFRSLIKDAKSEEEVRKIFEKAYGFDGLKSLSAKEKEDLSGKAKTYEGKLHQLTQNLTKIHGYSQTDLDTFFQVYKIPQDRLIQYVSDKLKESELPQHEQQRLEQGRQAKLEADYYKEQVQRSEQNNQQLFKQQHDFAMSHALSSPDVQSFQREFDQRMGPGAFLEHVNDYGEKVFRNQNGRYVPPQEAVNAVAQRYRQGFIQNNPSQQQANPALNGSEPPPPVIPNVGSGRSVSPTKPKFKNLDQLKKHVKEMTKEA